MFRQGAPKLGELRWSQKSLPDVVFLQHREIRSGGRDRSPECETESAVPDRSTSCGGGVRGRLTRPERLRQRGIEPFCSWALVCSGGFWVWGWCPSGLA